MNLEPLISRKFLLAMSTLASCTWLCAVERIADGVYSTVVIATVGAYLTANVMQKRDTTLKQ